MSDEEDDYMSNAFIVPQANDKPKDNFSTWRKRRLNIKDEKPHNSEEKSQIKRPKKQKELQKETREKGLSTAITSDNLGFKLMAKMGYKSGEGLGKSSAGRKEPIPIVIKSSRSGLGKEAREKEKMERKLKVQMAAMKARQRMNQVLQKDFQSRMRDQYAEQTFERDLYKSQKVCHQLDCDKDISEPKQSYYWPEAALNKPSKGDEESSCVAYEESDDEEDFTELSAEEKLKSITQYLRMNYFYCVWCAIKYNDLDDMIANCPGDTKLLHDDDD